MGKLSSIGQVNFRKGGNRFDDELSVDYANAGTMLGKSNQAVLLGASSLKQMDQLSGSATSGKDTFLKMLKNKD